MLTVPLALSEVVTVIVAEHGTSVKSVIRFNFGSL